MVSHEIIYFDFPGRAEAIRIMLHAAGIEFTDTRLKGADWPTVKPTTPLGQVPVLKIDGKSHCQSVALVRYAAKASACYPDDALQALQVDEVVDSLNELMSKAPHSKDEDELKKLRANYQKTTMTQYAKFVEDIIQANGGTYVAGNSITMADIALKGVIEGIETGFWDFIDKDFFKDYAGIMATAKAVSEDPKVVNYHKSKE